MSSIPPGYKQTEIGIIPDDWEVKTIDEWFMILPNNTYSRENMSNINGNIKNIHYGDILIKYKSILDCNKVKIPCLRKDAVISSRSSFLSSGDIVMADTAEDAVVGKVLEVINVENKLIVAGLHTIPLHSRQRKFAIGFLGYYFNSVYYHNQLLPLITGIKVSSISKLSVKNTYVLCPPEKEQAAIAEALSDMDALIEATEKLIAKKKAVKQGTMQQLLTGKKRLPGFTGKWDDVQLDGIIKTSSGGTPHRNVDKYYKGRIPWITTSELKDSTIYASIEQISTEALMHSSAKLFPVNTVIMAMYGATIGKLGVLKIEAATNQACCALFCNEKIVHYKWLYYYLLSIRDVIIAMGCGAGQPNISQTIIKKIELTLPQLKEQEAIAKILSDMDDEIDTLEKKLTKCRQIKQGMMSELLTGRIRLPYQQSASTAIKASKKAPKVKKGDTKKVIETKAKGHSAGYNDAVIMVGLVNSFGSPDYPFTAFDCQKFPYLLHRHLEGNAQGYKKFAAGPYNPTLVYKTAKPIALKKKYIREYVGKYKGFILDENAQEALKYFAEWFGEEPLKWLAQFRFIPKRKDELELLTTVDMAMVELRDNQKEITVPAVKEIIQNSEEWKEKLKRELFIDKNIDRAIQWSYRLFGKEEIS